MESGVNRKGKKTNPTPAKKKQPSRKKSAIAKNQNLSKEKKTAKPNSRKSLLSTITTKNSRLKRNSATKKNIAAKTVNIARKTANARAVKPKQPLLLAIYTVAIIVGISTILGTTISVANSFTAPFPQQEAIATKEKSENSPNQSRLQQLLNIASLGQEIAPLKLKIEELAQEYPTLEPEVFLVDLDTKGFVSIRGKQEIASASTIKLPVLVAFFQDLDRGKIRLDEQLTMTKELMAGGSGDMQYQKPGTKFSALETATKMIIISDNTATNMLIDRLGGMEVLNRRFVTMGLANTKLRNPLPDLTGTNTSSPEDLGSLLIKIDRGELVSLRSRDRLLHIMGNVEKDTLLPQGLESGALIAHKTGDIKSVLGDVGTIDMPNGKRYIASMLIKRPDNAPEAKEFIQKASGIAYQYFKNPQTQSLKIEEE
ncbi:serine hydrolase [Waterburya agarophytonicola K14]|uniref:Serine hydrolase n=1 Tax=Waterburya agarophytonicola KI4 TaxID=2874699 RepID=A0A964BTP2_9CYAN|nr:serine hydrolase [Waterburya agarophytonicola]MCC0178929.1 serine hydrolase [Waterburya agarophytonicola KI4]